MQSEVSPNDLMNYPGVYPYGQQTRQLLIGNRELGQPKYSYGGAISTEPRNEITPKIVSYCSLQKPVKRLQDCSNRLSVWDRLDKSKAPVKKKKKSNSDITKLLQPKNAAGLLQQIKPGSSFKVVESQSDPTKFTAYVELNNKLLASGVGTSKIQAKNNAAENFLKSLLGSEIIDNVGIKDTQTSDALVPLASFALYKLLKEWGSTKNEKPKVRFGTSIAAEKVKLKELPPNALSIHPTGLLNQMMPGTKAIEIRRTPPPDNKITMGYKIDGITYTGTAQSKKEARKEAARAVLFKFYGLKYP